MLYNIYSFFSTGTNVVNLSTRGRCVCVRACAIQTRGDIIDNHWNPNGMFCIFPDHRHGDVLYIIILYYLIYTDSYNAAEISVKSYRPIKNHVRGMCAIGNNGTTYGWNTRAIMRHAADSTYNNIMCSAVRGVCPISIYVYYKQTRRMSPLYYYCCTHNLYLPIC